MSFEPRLYIGCEKALRFMAQIEDRHAEPVDLTRRHLKPFSDLLPSQDPAELVTPLGLCFTS